MSKADVSHAFQNVLVDFDQKYNSCFLLGGVIIVDFRLTFGWSGSPGFYGSLAAAAENEHCNTTLESARLIDEGKKMMARVKVAEAWEGESRSPVPPEAKIRLHPGRGKSDPIFSK